MGMRALFQTSEFFWRMGKEALFQNSELCCRMGKEASFQTSELCREMGMDAFISDFRIVLKDGYGSRHAICHGCTDIIHVTYLFFG